MSADIKRGMTDEQKYQLLLIDAICGAGFAGSITIASECERVGMACFVGNQHNPDWQWDRKALWNVAVDDLQELYSGLCEQREKNMEPTAPLDEPESLIILQ